MEFNNRKLVELIKEFGFKEGPNEDFYFHPQDRNKMKPILTKRACATIADEREYSPLRPIVQEVAGRVAVSGYWTTRGGKKVWTTGEANPAGKSVEGSHPVAMAEKRWKVRGIIALECGEGSGIYAEDEFTDEYKAEARKQAPKPDRVEPATNTESPNMAEWWAGVCAAISEATGKPRASFEWQLFSHSSRREHSGKWWCPWDKWSDCKTFPKLAEYDQKWASVAYGAAAEVREALKGGSPASLYERDEGRKNLQLLVTLNPTASSDSVGDAKGED